MVFTKVDFYIHTGRKLILRLWFSPSIKQNTNNIAMVQSSPTLRKRRHIYQTKGLFYSKHIAYRKQDKKIKRLLYLCCKQIFLRYLKDSLKAPLFNKAKPALFSQTSTDIYFGTNFDESTENALTVHCTAYALGSLNGPNGLDQRTVQYYKKFPDMQELMDFASVQVKEDKQWQGCMKNLFFNFCSIKLYFSYTDEKGHLIKKSTRWHSDSGYTKSGKPRADNSQVAGTPVVIFTFGDEKNLWFQKQLNKKSIQYNTPLHFQQKSGSMVVLDARDEIPDASGFRWLHSSNMDKAGTFTVSLIFWVVSKSVEVKKVILLCLIHNSLRILKLI